MAGARAHYDQLLGDVYRWSTGAGDPYERGAAWLARHQLDQHARYLDLGAGFGAHAVPLARAGKSVVAVDFHAGLLAELRAAAPGVETHCDDLVAFLAGGGGGGTAGPWDAVLCLGDTLTHLADPGAVRALLAGAARVLTPGGVLALAYRDYTGPPRLGVDRFIPVRADSQRSLLCCLDLLDADHVSVTDILTLADPSGLRTQVSSYTKLRLAPASIVAWAAATGLALDRATSDQGMQLQIFRAA